MVSNPFDTEDQVVIGETPTPNVPVELLTGLLRPFEGSARAILVALLGGQNRRMAALSGGVTGTTMREWIQRDRAFAEAVSLAEDIGLAGTFESELYRRAMAGTEDKGSIRALEMVLKARSADYREKAQVSMEVTHRAASAGQAMIEGYTPAADSHTT